MQTLYLKGTLILLKLDAMKTKYLYLLFFLLILGCKKIEEIPKEITILKPAEDLADTLKVIFPEGEDFFLSNQDFFSATIKKNIILAKESKVYVTFIDEGAVYRNTLCWYSYNVSQPPSKVSDIKKNVLFPNISKKDEGGLLEHGFTVQLGTEKFQPGTVIGFALILNGWEDGTVNYNNLTHYTDYSFNAGGNQQHILFKTASFDYIVIGFEDISISDVECDKDFNDILFAISDNNEGYEATSFDLSNVVVY
jgi:hypothetical protein